MAAAGCGSAGSVGAGPGREARLPPRWWAAALRRPAPHRAAAPAVPLRVSLLSPAPLYAFGGFVVTSGCVFAVSCCSSVVLPKQRRGLKTFLFLANFYQIPRVAFWLGCLG